MNLRPRILMVTTQLGYGGAETSFIRLANYLAQTSDVTVALFTPTYGRTDYASGHEALRARKVVIDLDVKKDRLARWWRRISVVRRLKREHDVTISFLTGPNLVNALSGHRSRSIVSLRGSRRYDPLATLRERLLFAYMLDPLTYALAKWIVPVSPGLMHELPRWVSRARVISIPPFIDKAALETKCNEPIPAEYGLLENQPVLVAVGRLSPEKGLQHLLVVMAMLSSMKTGVKLLLVGDGPSADGLRAQAIHLGFAVDDLRPGVSAVIFAGYQANVMPFIKLARVLVLASSTEGFPSVLLEAMASGVPVIANDAPWGARAILQPELVASELPYATVRATRTAYGALMPRIDDAVHHRAWVQQLLQHLEARTDTSYAAKTRIDEFVIERVGARWQQLIDSVMAS